MSRLKKIILMSSLALLTTLVFPLLAVHIVKGDNGMAVALLTFFCFQSLGGGHNRHHIGNGHSLPVFSTACVFDAFLGVRCAHF